MLVSLQSPQSQSLAADALVRCAAAALVPASLQPGLQRLSAQPAEAEAAEAATWGTALTVGLAVAMADIVLQVEVGGCTRHKIQGGRCALMSASQLCLACCARCWPPLPNMPARDSLQRARPAGAEPGWRGGNKSPFLSCSGPGSCTACGSCCACSCIGLSVCPGGLR